MTNAAAFALGAFTVLALPFLSCRPLANDHELYDCSRKTLEDQRWLINACNALKDKS